ncbi:MAG: preprotein translocase subunit SecA, partial [Lentisphaeria bacterium]
MVFSLLKKVFKSHNDRRVAYYRSRVAKINKFYESYNTLSDAELKAKTEQFKMRFKNGESLDSLMPEAYAVVKDACRRLLGSQHDVLGHTLTWDMLPYDVQLIGGMVIHDCGIAEMATGEGKTLVATFPLYLNALTGKNCQLVTVNEYLARRDSQWMGVLLKFLGLTVGCIQNAQYPALKRAQYQCDVTYGTNSEFGFDYLRDMGASSKEDMVQRDHYFTIVDEIDSILIDEARTPLIISGPADKSTHKYDLLQPAVESVYRQQNILCTEIINNARAVLENESAQESDLDSAVLDLVRVKLGMPKHKQLMRLMEDPKYRRMLDKKEAEVRSTSNKGWLERTKETLYFSIDEQANDVSLSEKGRQLINPDDADAFVLPDLAMLLSQIDAENSDDVSRLKKRQELQEFYEERSEVIHNITQLLKAYVLFEKDVHYVIADNKVMIVDEHTGRIMDGRRFSDG